MSQGSESSDSSIIEDITVISSSQEIETPLSSQDSQEFYTCTCTCPDGNDSSAQGEDPGQIERSTTSMGNQSQETSQPDLKSSQQSQEQATQQNQPDTESIEKEANSQ